jgi:sorting nexin-8
VPANDTLLNPSGSHLSKGSQPTPSVATLDHDPNLDRRKRRKTVKDAPELLESGHSSESDEPRHDNLKIEVQSAGTSTKTPERSEARDHEDILPVPGKEQPQQAIAEVPGATKNDPSVDVEKKRKVVKLNANGKLLSSPVANKLGEKPKTRGKRGKPAAHNIEDPQSKIVVIKYHSQPGSFGSLGKHIEDILAGREKYFARTVLTNPAVAPKVVSSPSSKATHPFFLKKAAQKPDVPISQPQTPVRAPMPIVDEQPKIKPANVHLASKPLMSFKHAFAKVPDPMHPLWPPLGLSHVRGSQPTFKPCHDNHDQGSDCRKSKTPAVRISDEEWVISSATDCPDDSAAVLRVPERQLASGRALQVMVAKQLTKTPTEHVSGGSRKEASHPAIMKLYSSLATSVTAFDLGGYESKLWAHKYAPGSAQQVLCATKEALMLRDWLNHLIVSSVETGSSSKDNEKSKRKEEKKRKRRKKADKLDGFVVDSDDEASEMGEISGSDDELAGDVTISTKKTVIRTGDLTINVRSGTERTRMANTILVSGPPGCGKTASIYAVAKEMGFEVFEINSGSRRSAKDILDRLGDMTQNHLVHNVHANRDSASNQVSSTDFQPSEDAKQDKLMGYFKPTSIGPYEKLGKGRAKASVKETDTNQARSQKQSLILLEEVDILFEEDKQFWTGVLTLINQSKRPIIMTCNDESLIPFNDISFHAILRYRTPPQDLAVDYLLLVAASEGHLLRREPIEKLYRSTNSDLRKSIVELNYWCQIAVGSEKSGLDWLIDRWPQGADLDESGDKLRVLSKDTYREYMGWFSRDMLISGGSSATSELQEETLNWWDLTLQDADTTEDSRHQFWASPNPGASRLELLDSLRHQSEHMDFRSDLDLLGTSCSLDARKVSFVMCFHSKKKKTKKKANFCRIPLTLLSLQCQKGRS